jgi:antitoxin (DNA-binding transcriptional repressor) of toxin-antitoxin stability system
MPWAFFALSGSNFMFLTIKSMLKASKENSMQTVTLQEAHAQLPQLLEQLQPGEELTITQEGQPLAQVRKAERTSWPCKAGSAAGKIRIAPDFDAPLEDFKEYMQ